MPVRGNPRPVAEAAGFDAPSTMLRLKPNQATSIMQITHAVEEQPVCSLSSRPAYCTFHCYIAASFEAPERALSVAIRCRYPAAGSPIQSIRDDCSNTQELFWKKPATDWTRYRHGLDSVANSRSLKTKDDI